MIGPKGMAFDNDDVLNVNDDEDLKNDPVSQMDMQVRFMVSLSCQHSLLVRPICIHSSANARPGTRAISQALLISYPSKRCSWFAKSSTNRVKKNISGWCIGYVNNAMLVTNLLCM